MQIRQIAFAAAGFLLCGCAIADTAPAEQAAAQDQERTGVVAGQRIFVDPETGKARAPTDEELAQMPKEPATPKKKLEAFTMPDGTVVLPAGAIVSRVVAERGADGKLTMHCEDHVDAQQ